MSNDVYKSVCEIIDDICEERMRINLHTELTEISLSSLEFVKMLLKVEEKFGIEFQLEDLSMERFVFLQDFITRIEELILENAIIKEA